MLQRGPVIGLVTAGRQPAGVERIERRVDAGVGPGQAVAGIQARRNVDPFDVRMHGVGRCLHRSRRGVIAQPGVGVPGILPAHAQPCRAGGFADQPAQSPLRVGNRGGGAAVAQGENLSRGLLDEPHGGRRAAGGKPFLRRGVRREVLHGGLEGAGRLPAELAEGPRERLGALVAGGQRDLGHAQHAFLQQAGRAGQAHAPYRHGHAFARDPRIEAVEVPGREMRQGGQVLEAVRGQRVRHDVRHHASDPRPVSGLRPACLHGRILPAGGPRCLAGFAQITGWRRRRGRGADRSQAGPASGRLQLLQQLQRRVSVGHLPDAQLEAAQAGTGGGAHHAVGGAGCKAAGVEGILQVAGLGARQRLQVAGPWSRDTGASGDLAREQAHAQGVVDGVVVAQDHPEIRPHHEGRPACARGHEDGGSVQRGQRLAVDGLHTLVRPLGGRVAHGELGALVVEARRQAHFHAPGLAGLPSHARQEVGGGRGDVRDAAPDVAVAVAVGVHRVTQEHGRQELGVAHGAGPGSDHAVGGDVALVDDAQRGQQFTVRPVAAAALVGQRGERIDGAEAAEVRPVVAFHAPDGGDGLGRHAVARGRRVQGCALFGQHIAAALDARGRHGAVQVGPGRARELGLGAVELDHLGQPLRAVQGCGDCFRADAGLQGLLPEARDPLREAGLVGLGGKRGGIGCRRGGLGRGGRGGLRARSGHGRRFRVGGDRRGWCGLRRGGGGSGGAAGQQGAEQARPGGGPPRPGGRGVDTGGRTEGRGGRRVASLHAPLSMAVAVPAYLRLEFYASLRFIDPCILFFGTTTKPSARTRGATAPRSSRASARTRT